MTQAPVRPVERATSARSAERRPTVWRRIRSAKVMYLFLLPGMIYFVVFAYLPLLGNVVAFQDYSPFRGIFGSALVGLDNFARMFGDPEVITALTNTVIISLLQIVFAFPAPILLALLLNSLLSDRLKRAVQTIVYLPHFIGWVIVISIWQEVLSGAGPVNLLLSGIGVGPIDFMSNPDTFQLLLVVQVVWKEIGWGTIIFFAAISGISPELYESAAVDGAGPWRRIWHVTLPGLTSVIVLLLILRLGSVLTVGFEQILIQQPAVGAAAAQVLDTFVYFRGVQGGDWGLSAAAGLFKGVIGTVLVIVANRWAKRLTGSGVF